MKILDINLVVLGVAITTALCFIAFMLINIGAGPEVTPDIKTILIVWFAIFFPPSFVVAFRATSAGALYGLVIGVVPVILAPLMGYIVPLFLYFIFYVFAPLGGFLGEVTAKFVFKPRPIAQADAGKCCDALLWLSWQHGLDQPLCIGKK